MSIWDNVKKFAQPYSDDEYDDYDEEEEMEEEYEEEPRRAPRNTRRSRPAPMQEEEDDEEDYGYSSNSGALASSSFSGISSGFNGSVLNMNTAAASSKQEVVLFRPISFNDAAKAADDLRNRKAVVCNMENVDEALARRVVDFLSGCVYALQGDVEKIAQSAYLFCPQNMGIVGNLDTIQDEIENYI